MLAYHANLLTGSPLSETTCLLAHGMVPALHRALQGYDLLAALAKRGTLCDVDLSNTGVQIDLLAAALAPAKQNKSRDGETGGGGGGHGGGGFHGEAVSAQGLNRLVLSNIG